MIVYLAGGISGNLKPAWKRLARREISGDGLMEVLQEEGFIKKRERNEDLPRRDKWKERYDVGVFGGVAPWKNEEIYDPIVRTHHPYILESFFYVDADTERLLPLFGDFLLDSGAFTFMQGKGGTPNWEEYIDKYADYIIVKFARMRRKNGKRTKSETK